MKRISSFIIAGLCIVLACVEDETLIDQIEASPNLVGFHTATQSLSGVADGTIYDFNVPLKVFGPSVKEINGSVTATVAIDPSSTAVEGTHFALENKTITLSKDGDFLGTLPIQMLSQGIAAPLATAPKLVLSVSSVDGAGNVIASAKKITLNFFYLCPHDLVGTYEVTIDHTRCKSAPYDGNFPFEVTISKNPDGSWHLSSADGGFLGRCTGNAGLDNAGDIVVVCGEVQFSDVLDYGSLDIGTITGGTWDEETGTLTLKHTQDFSANWPANWTSVYVRK